MNNYQVGMKGQQTAETFLQSTGYKIIAKNYRIKTGEIDLIVKSKNLQDYIVFVEVKYRRSLSHGLPREAVGFHKQKKIINTAMYYINSNNLNDYNFRFDVLEILEQNNKFYANHIQDAFDLTY